MIIRLKILLLFTFLLSSVSANNIYRWKELPPPTDVPTRLLVGNSTSNFYLIDKFGDLFHFNEGAWKVFTVPDTKYYSDYKWVKISKDAFLVACMDTEWKTHFYILENSKWRKLKYINPTPIHNVFSKDGITYIYGNFGTFLKYSNGELVKIKTKIENHINYFLFSSPEEIYLGVKAEGVYKYNGKTFKHIPFPQNKYNEVGGIYKSKSNNILVRDFSYRIYEIYKDTLKLINPPKKIFAEPERENFGFRELRYTKNDSMIKVYFPNSIPLSSFRVFNDSILVTTSTGKIYLGTKSENNYFIDLANDYNIPGISNITAQGSAFVQNDSDSNLDIFILYISDNYSSRLYKNIPYSPFLDISVSTDLYKIKKVTNFCFADLNSDNSKDFFSISSDSVGKWLSIYTKETKFKKSSSINLSNFIKVRHPRNIKAIDYDKDGDLDIELVYYYGEGPKSGYLLFFENKFWGNDFEPDTSLSQTSKGWNISSIFADFNDDDNNDFFLISMWRTNKFLINSDSSWIDETEKRFSPFPRLDAKAGGAIDYDNDGDLDIFILTNSLELIIYNNNGNGFFKKSEIKIELESSKFIRGGQKSINFGDFNNDGFTDVFMTFSENSKSENVILINNSAEEFIDKTDEFNIRLPYVINTSLGDIDNDGDLDILGTKYGKNLFWINNLNDDNYLELLLHGSKSNTQGLHAKVYIYEEGFLNNASHLIAFQQSGSFDTGINTQNSSILHFGLNSEKKYDIKIKFYGGKEKYITSVGTGQILHVYESGSFSTFIRSIPRYLYKVATSKTIHLYSFLVLLGFLLIYLEIVFALKYFSWNTLLTSIIITSNISLYYLILFLSSSGNTIFIRYILPILVLVGSLLFTNLIFVLIKKYQTPVGKSEEEYLNDLLSQIMQFTHGEWALRSLNSLHLYCSNPLDSYDDNYLKQFESRKNTFLNSTAPAINQIVQIHNNISRTDETIENIDRSNNFLVEKLSQIEKLSPELNSQLGTIASELQLIMRSLSEFKRNLFKSFSSNIEEVVNSIVENLKPITDENNINLRVISKLNEKKFALIKNYELSDIIDNSIHNSILALTDKNNTRSITLHLYNKVPHICIDIIDNGNGIKNDNWNKIFEKGYTENNGTGLGLYFAKIILEKYGGRIFVQESEIGEGTIFTIEMIEGVYNA